MGPGSIILLTICGIVFGGGAILVSKLLNKSYSNNAKLEPYECGIPVKTGAWGQFSVGYYLFALVFLVFDVELIFLYPWAVVVKHIGWFAFAEALVFIFILFLGLLYAHKKGALKWT